MKIVPTPQTRTMVFLTMARVVPAVHFMEVPEIPNASPWVPPCSYQLGAAIRGGYVRQMYPSDFDWRRVSLRPKRHSQHCSNNATAAVKIPDGRPPAPLADTLKSRWNGQASRTPKAPPRTTTDLPDTGVLLSRRLS